MTMHNPKSTVEQIRERFDHDVERFSNLETGQSATIDASLAMSLIAQSAAATTPDATHGLDVGCGAGNYSLKLLEQLPDLNLTLVDLSQPMLQRASERIQEKSKRGSKIHQGDIRNLSFQDETFDVIMAAAVLHHLRSDAEWETVFANFFRWLKPGGAVWIFDLVESSIPAVEVLSKKRYGKYLTELKDEAYRDHVFEYIKQEDTPRPLMFQLNLLQSVGFSQVELLHKNSCFAAFGAVKN